MVRTSMGTVGVPAMQRQPITYLKACENTWVALTQVALDCCISTMLVLIAEDHPGFEEVTSRGVGTGVKHTSLCPINGMASIYSVHFLLELRGLYLRYIWFLVFLDALVKGPTVNYIHLAIHVRGLGL